MDAVLFYEVNVSFLEEGVGSKTPLGVVAKDRSLFLLRKEKEI